MPRQKGHPKTGGRKKGQPNKGTTVIKDFRARLETNKVDLESELAKAIATGNVDMIKALASLLPYLSPRLKETEAQAPAPSDENDDPATVLQLLKNNLDSDT